MVPIMRSREAIGLVVLQENPLHQCVLTIIVTLSIVEKLDRDILNYPVTLMISVNTTGQGLLVENVVQDIL